MVSDLFGKCPLVWNLLAEATSQTLWQQLSSDQKARLLAALAAFLILGTGAVLLTWLGARITLRYMRARDGKKRAPIQAGNWWSKPLTSSAWLPDDNQTDSSA